MATPLTARESGIGDAGREGVGEVVVSRRVVMRPSKYRMMSRSGSGDAGEITPVVV